MNIATAQQKVKKIMKDNCFRREVLTSSGKVNFNRLGMYQSSKLLFTRPSEKQGKKYYIELLVDASGSMWNRDLAELAHQAAEQIAKTLGKHCDLKITLFNYLEYTVRWQDYKAEDWSKSYDVYGNYHEVVDKQGRRLIVNDKQAKLYKEKNRSDAAAAGNWEICNILNAVKRLKQKNGRKLIIVLLDGRPNLDNHDEENDPVYVAGHRIDKYPRSSYRKQIEGIEAQGITVLGYGINTTEPKQFFPNFQEIKGAEEILPTLVKSLEKHIKK